MAQQNPIDLDRRFVPLTDRRQTNLDVELLAGRTSDIDWSSLLAKPRVVLLAEAGGGKSTEMIERTRLLRAEGRFAFYVTVQDIAHEGLEGALDPPQDMAFKLWRQSEQPAWLFLDSVDWRRRLPFAKISTRIDLLTLSAYLRSHASPIAPNNQGGRHRRDTTQLSNAIRG